MENVKTENALIHQMLHNIEFFGVSEIVIVKPPIDTRDCVIFSMN